MKLPFVVRDRNVQANFDKIATQFTTLTMPPPIYVGVTAGAPAFAGTWVNFDATRIAAFYKHDGRVYLSGVIKSGVIGTAAFTLPAGYLPIYGHDYAVNSNGAFGVVVVSSAGVVTPAVGNNAYVFLDGIHFRHA